VNPVPDPLLVFFFYWHEYPTVLNRMRLCWKPVTEICVYNITLIGSVCVYVCVCVREGERESGRERDYRRGV
jgi:hypothetical protein